jgi:hypothetical protein
MSDKDEVRLSVPIPRDMHTKLEVLLQWGLKAPTVRMLLQLLLDAQKEAGNRYILTDLIEGRCKLIRTETQIRSNFEQNGGDNEEA